MGIGGGIFLVPALITLFHVEAEHARTASLVAVCVTSLAASLIYLKEQMVDLTYAGYLQLPTAIGALAGALVGERLSEDAVRVLFALFLVVVSGRLIAKQQDALPGSSHHRNTWLAASAACLGAGIVSSLLGVGGGIIFVPVLTLLLARPVRIAAATSTYLIGLTGAASALVYVRGMTRAGPDPMLVSVAVPSVVGIFVGAQIGARVSKVLPGERLRLAFAALMLINAGLLVWKVLDG